MPFQRNSIKTGLSFGLTSGIITTLGLMTGLNSSTHSQSVVIGGILTIAIADALSDALGIHVSEELKEESHHAHIWEATISTFFSKLVFSLTFLVPILLLDLKAAIIVSIIWGTLLLAIFSYKIAKDKAHNPWAAILEHVFLLAVVLAITSYIGKAVNLIN